MTRRKARRQRVLLSMLRRKLRWARHLQRIGAHVWLRDNRYQKAANIMMSSRRPLLTMWGLGHGRDAIEPPSIIGRSW